MIEIKNLTKEFITKEQKVVALDNINLSINDGEIFGIIGLSGAGKSTLLRTLSALEKPTSGEVLMDNQNIHKLNKKELLNLRSNMGVVFQGYNLIEQKNVYTNISYPLQVRKETKENIKNRVVELLDLVGISDKINAYPSMLSGGQCQRVAIARALSTKPKILLMDELTSALDPVTTKQIINLLKKINEELHVTIIIITHEIRVARMICEEIAVVDDGKIVEVGKTNDVLTNPQSDITKLLLGGDINE